MESVLCSCTCTCTRVKYLFLYSSFATCCKDHPIHLWDAFYGHNRCSYVAYNHMVSGKCMCYNFEHVQVHNLHCKVVLLISPTCTCAHHMHMYTYVMVICSALNHSDLCLCLYRGEHYTLCLTTCYM